MSDAPHESPVWVLAIAVAVVLALGVTLWPASERIEWSAQQKREIGRLATLLSSPEVSADRIVEELRSASRFPPEPRAARTLADALVTCGTASLGETQRTQLAQRIYAITTSGDRFTGALPDLLSGIRQAEESTGCSPTTIESLLAAARAVARRDPSPRRDWW
jgi:hypothetical protein